MIKAKAIKTNIFNPPKDDLFLLIKKSIKSLEEKSIIVFTSKIVSIWQGRCLKKGKINKEELIKKESDLYIERDSKKSFFLTIKNNILMPAAGIDESNANDYYILPPKNPHLAAKKIYQFIKKNYHLKKFGVIISDSHTIPLRWGTIGISLGYYGFYPLRDYRGKRDIFGRKLKITQLNLVDSLAAFAVFLMGEGNEQTPIAVISGLDNIKFGKFKIKKDILKIERKKDIYKSLIESIKWKKYYENKR